MNSQRAPTSIKTVRIIDGQLPLDIRSDPEAYYLIQHQIRTTEHDSDGNDAVSSSFEFYWISRTEIIKSSFGLGLLEKWLALDQDAPPDRRRSSLVNRLRDCYDCEYTALSQSAPQGMDELTHSWYMKKIREMDTISFEFDVGVYQNLRVSRSWCIALCSDHTLVCKGTLEWTSNLSSSVFNYPRPGLLNRKLE